MKWHMHLFRFAQARLAANASQRLSGNLINSATAWWMTRLMYYEVITKNGIILYPRNVIWKDVYADEFIPEMRLLGHDWRDPKPGKATMQIDARVWTRRMGTSILLTLGRGLWHHFFEH